MRTRILKNKKRNQSKIPNSALIHDLPFFVKEHQEIRKQLYGDNRPLSAKDLNHIKKRVFNSNKIYISDRNQRFANRYKTLSTFSRNKLLSMISQLSDENLRGLLATLTWDTITKSLNQIIDANVTPPPKKLKKNPVWEGENIFGKEISPNKLIFGMATPLSTPVPIESVLTSTLGGDMPLSTPVPIE